MTILVTGAAGVLGRSLATKLQTHEETVLAVRTPRDRSAVVCDLTQPGPVRTLIARVRPRLVYHLAGSFSNDYATDYPVNAHAAMLLMDATRAANLDTRFVFIGSAAEYGVVQAAENPISENRALRPVSAYGVTKAMQTQIATWYAYERGVDVVVARMFNLLASGLSVRLFPGRVEQEISRYRRGESMVIEVGNLNSRRDYVSVEQATDQIQLIARRGQRGEVYHVGSGQPTLVRDLLNRMLDESGVPREAVRQKPVQVGARYDSPVIYADLSRTTALATTG